jgi:hypothetical protein
MERSELIRAPPRRLAAARGAAKPGAPKHFQHGCVTAFRGRDTIPTAPPSPARAARIRPSCVISAKKSHAFSLPEDAPTENDAPSPDAASKLRSMRQVSERGVTSETSRVILLELAPNISRSHHLLRLRVKLRHDEPSWTDLMRRQRRRIIASLHCFISSYTATPPAMLRRRIVKSPRIWLCCFASSRVASLLHAPDRPRQRRRRWGI